MSIIISGLRLAVFFRGPLASNLGRRRLPETPCTLLSDDHIRENIPSFYFLAFFLWLVLFALTGCGGGGSSGGGSSTAPVATSASLSTPENTRVNGVLQSTNPSGNTLTFRIVRNASLGNVTITDTATGVYTYTPITNINGTDSFDFVANDGANDSNVATITITIIANRPPVAVADAYLVTQPGGTLVINAPGVLANDTDPDGNPITAVQFTQPAHGTLSTSANGAFTYVHDGSANYTDSFTYRASDGSQTSNATTVTLTINRPPVASNGCKNTAWNTSFSSFDLKPLVTDPDNSPSQLAFTIIAQGTKGTAAVDANGIFSYSPNDSTFTGADSVTYQVSDPSGLQATAQVKIAIGNRIMPLGDSITSGVFTSSTVPSPAARVSYRRKLYNDLTAGGKNTIEFRGQYSEGLSANPAIVDPFHEGRLGLRDDTLASSVIARLNGTLNDPNDGRPSLLNNGAPDIILLHIGTNGIDGSDNASATDVQTTLDNINTWETSITGRPVTVLLALILGSPNSTFNVNATARNANVDTMARARPEFGTRLFLVDIQNGAGLAYTIDNDSGGAGDMADNLHPDTSGYEKMADAWKNALITNGLVCP
jgi:VCBS repeat-containing protein